MKNGTLYNRTVDILVEAYFNDTLEHQNCYACAVGNIIAANCGFKFIHPSSTRDTPKNVYAGGGLLYWDKKNDFHLNPVRYLTTERERMELPKESLRLVKSTGYSYKELSIIEKAFESVGKENINEDEDKKMFIGLCAVIDALDIIHENTDATATQVTKEKFLKPDTINQKVNV